METRLGSYVVEKVELFNSKRLVDSGDNPEKIRSLFKRFSADKFRYGKLCLYRSPHTMNSDFVLILELGKSGGDFLIPLAYLTQ